VAGAFFVLVSALVQVVSKRGEKFEISHKKNTLKHKKKKRANLYMVLSAP